MDSPTERNEQEVPFVFQFKKETKGTIKDLEKSLVTGNPETLPPPVD